MMIGARASPARTPRSPSLRATSTTRRRRRRTRPSGRRSSRPARHGSGAGATAATPSVGCIFLWRLGTFRNQLQNPSPHPCPGKGPCLATPRDAPPTR